MGVRVLLLAISFVATFAQRDDAFERIGMLEVSRTPVRWMSPESLVRDLRSEDKANRVKALRLLGVKDRFVAYGEAKQIDLRYASFGPNTVAVLAVEESTSFVYAAVAVRSSGDWERLAVFECWCKYEAPLDDFVHAGYTWSDDKPELQVVARASGGGTGLYEQTEVRFLLHNGELRQVLSFVSKKSAFVIGSGGMSLHERRWFKDDRLVEAKATVKSKDEIDWDLTDGRNFKSITCTPYKWDAANFTYVRSSAAHPCKYEPPP